MKVFGHKKIAVIYCQTYPIVINVNIGIPGRPLSLVNFVVFLASITEHISYPSQYKDLGLSLSFVAYLFGLLPEPKEIRDSMTWKKNMTGWSI